MRPRSSVLILTIVLLSWSSTSLFAAWLPDGTPICTSTGMQYNPQIAPDGTGGAFIAWNDWAIGGDIVVTRVLADGTTAPGWPSNGRRACASVENRTLVGCVPSDSGGVILVWAGYGLQGYSAFSLGLAQDGTRRMGWGADGNVVLQPWHARVRLQDYRVISDGDGGFWIGVVAEWSDLCHDCYRSVGAHLHHAASAVTPPPFYPLSLASAWLDGWLSQPIWSSDDRGGVLFAVGLGASGGWFADNIGSVHSRGTVAWAAQVSGPEFMSGLSDLARDEAGGAYVTGAAQSTAGRSTVGLLRFDSSGSIAHGWPAAGVLPGDSLSNQYSGLLTSDDQGGVFLAWSEVTSSASLRVLRVNASGVVPPPWPANGIALCRASGNHWNLQRLPDGRGGASYVWEDDRGGESDLFTARVDRDGTLANRAYPDGAPLCVAPGVQTTPRVVSTAPGIAIAVWQDQRSGSSEADIYARALPFDAVVPTTVSLVDFSAHADRVTLRWLVSGSGAERFSIERNREGRGWEAVGESSRDGTDVVLYEDRAVGSGDRIEYRLQWFEDGRAAWSQPVAVEVPASPRLELRGFDPNPCAGEPRVAFTLEGDAAARIELFDISGRRVAVRDLSGLAAGSHAVTMGPETRLRPGVYLIRLHEGDRALIARGFIVN